MTAEQFVKLCFEEKERTLQSYFDQNGGTAVGRIIRLLIEQGAREEDVHELVSSVLEETYYGILLALDGEASLGGVQMIYKIFDEDDNLLSECGDLEGGAYEYLMEERNNKIRNRL